MPQVELSSLSGPELRRLLDATRARGQAALTYQILQEMAARRDAPKPARLSLMRRPTEPRVVALRLDDQLEPEDEIEDEPEVEATPEAAEVSAAPPPEPAPMRPPRRRNAPSPPPDARVEPTPPPPKPRGVWDSEPEPPGDTKGWSLPLPHLALEGVRPPRRLGWGAAAGFAAGVTLGVVGGWWGAGMLRETPPPVTPPAAGELQIAEVTPPPEPTAPPAADIGESIPEAPPQTAEVTPPTELAEAPATSPDTADLAQDATAQALDPQPTQASAPGDACAAQPNPADRAICGDPELRRLQRDLRQAYAEALEAHEERGLLRQRQLAWASARDAVSDPERLAALYEARIRRLNAATAAARQSR